MIKMETINFQQAIKQGSLTTYVERHSGKCQHRGQLDLCCTDLLRIFWEEEQWACDLVKAVWMKLEIGLLPDVQHMVDPWRIGWDPPQLAVHRIRTLGETWHRTVQLEKEEEGRNREREHYMKTSQFTFRRPWMSGWGDGICPGASPELLWSYPISQSESCVRLSFPIYKMGVWVRRELY